LILCKCRAEETQIQLSHPSSTFSRLGQPLDDEDDPNSGATNILGSEKVRALIHVIWISMLNQNKGYSNLVGWWLILFK